jgi:hypothetical protein
VEDYRPGVDHFPDKITPAYARIFTVSYHGHYKVVKLAVERTTTGDSRPSDTMLPEIY